MRKRLLILVLLVAAAGTWIFLNHSTPKVVDPIFIPTGAPTSIMADFDPINRQLYILHDAMDDADVKVTRLSADSFKRLGTYTLGKFVTEIRYSPSRSKLYYLEDIMGQKGKLWEYDCARKRDIRSVEIEAIPQSLLLSNDGQYAFVACGEYPKAVFDMSIDPEEDPEFWDERRGHVLKVDLNTFSVVASQETYSGPLFMEIDDSDSFLLVTNSVRNSTPEAIETSVQGLPAYQVTGRVDVHYMVERFNTTSLTLVEEFETGTCVLGTSENNLALIGGNSFGFETTYPTLLVNLATGDKQEIDMSAYDYESMSNSAVSSSLNKAFIMRVHETEPKGDMIVVNLTDLSSYQYHVADYGFNQIIVDEAGDQLILMNNQGYGLVSVSPIP